MRKSIASLIPVLVVGLLLQSCREQPSPEGSVTSDSAQSAELDSRQPATPDSVVTFEYVYPNNTTLVENHYIELAYHRGSVAGRYYGTTDDFDNAREGYLPGFFATTMNDLRIAGDAISFILAPHDIFISPRTPGADRDAVTDETRWKGPRIAPTRSYQGVISPYQITLQTPGGPREFQRATPGRPISDPARTDSTDADTTAVSERTAGES